MCGQRPVPVLPLARRGCGRRGPSGYGFVLHRVIDVGLPTSLGRGFRRCDLLVDRREWLALPASSFTEPRHWRVKLALCISSFTLHRRLARGFGGKPVLQLEEKLQLREACGTRWPITIPGRRRRRTSPPELQSELLSPPLSSPSSRESPLSTGNVIACCVAAAGRCGSAETRAQVTFEVEKTDRNFVSTRRALREKMGAGPKYQHGSPFGRCLSGLFTLKNPVWGKNIGLFGGGEPNHEL